MFPRDHCYHYCGQAIRELEHANPQEDFLPFATIWYKHFLEQIEPIITPVP